MGHVENHLDAYDVIRKECSHCGHGTNPRIIHLTGECPRCGRMGVPVKGWKNKKKE